MRTAYQESKLNNVQHLLGDYFNIAINGYFQTPEKAYRKLLVSQYGSLISKGNSAIVNGKTGYELFLDVMDDTSYTKTTVKELSIKSTSKEYWAGWILAYLQWATARSFDSLYEFIPFEKMISFYNPYHEMDERTFVDDIYKKYLLKKTNLNRIRKRNKLTQKELANKSNVSIRTIQTIEQRKNDINQMKSINLYNISRTLNCSMEDLLE